MDNDNFQEKLKNLNKTLLELAQNNKVVDKSAILEEIDSLLKLKPDNIRLLELKAMYHSMLFDVDKVQETCAKILALNPNNENAKMLLANLQQGTPKTSPQKIKNKKNKKKNNNVKLSGIEKVPIDFIISGKLITILIIIIANFVYFTNSVTKQLTYKIPKIGDDTKSVNIKINPQTDYDYLSKKRIYNIRKKYVRNSIFKSEDYEPNEKVFGSIVGYKPWWGNITCLPLNYTGDYHERIEGDSKVSSQINNPSALVGISLPYMPWSEKNNQDFCNSEYSQFIPYSLSYNEQKKLITARYKVPKRFIHYREKINGEIKPYVLQLSGLNALDFGYNYVYLTQVYNTEMSYPDNDISKNYAEFKDYIHLGGSCNYQDGCNNISPMQNNMMISIKNLPAEIKLKLWKRKPLNKNFKADFYYNIIFDEQ